MVDRVCRDISDSITRFSHYSQETIRMSYVSSADSPSVEWTVGGLFGANMDYLTGQLT